MLRLLLVRHATCDGTGHRLNGRASGIPLNREGVAQAMALVDALQDEPIAAVYTSPLQRAVETAALIATAHAAEPVIEESFNEVDFGDWTGRAIEDLEHDAVWKDFNTLRATTAVPAGELMLDVQRRALAGVLALQQQHENETVVIVSHGDVIRALIACFLAMPLDCMLRLEISPGSVTEVELHGAWPQVRSVNRVSRSSG